MIHFIYADALSDHPVLQRTMFTDRARQFSERLKWSVRVDDDGFERDEYDDMNPLYVIAEANGRHSGSMRFLPTTGPIMVNDHFSHLAGDVRISSPLIWECTRFCVAPDAPRTTSAALMLAAAELGRRAYLSHSVAVFDARMVRVYRRMGWAPDILGSDGTGRDRISVGLWAFDEAPVAALAAQAGVEPARASDWYRTSFQKPKAALAG